jgi:hypothetical protein
MADDSPVTVFDNIDDMADRLTDGCVLIINTLVLRIFYQGIASDGDDDQFGHGSHPAEMLLEAISKIGFWFKIAAGPSFPAERDFPPDPIRFVGRKPEVRLRRIEGFEARHQQRYWAKRHF